MRQVHRREQFDAALGAAGRVSVRKALGLRPGAKVDFVAQGDGFKVVALDTHVSTLKGRFAGRVAKPFNLESMDRAIADAASSGHRKP